MRRLIFFGLIWALVPLLTSCENSKKEVQMILLEKSWTQSFEEKTTENIEIYRPSDSKNFPMARYRQIFNFLDNEVCEFLVLADNDAHAMEKGRWYFNDKASSIKISNLDSELLYDFEIVQLTEDILMLKTKN